jgi:hypothetical protein
VTRNGASRLRKQQRKQEQTPRHSARQNVVQKRFISKIFLITSLFFCVLFPLFWVDVHIGDARYRSSIYTLVHTL